jgi:putative oxidoreductase
MAIAFLIGRIILGVYYLYSAVHHFMGIKMMSGYAASKGVPAPTLAVGGSGLLLLLGSLSILLGYQPYIGAIMIVVFLVPVAFMMHNFWAVSDPQAKMGERINFMKDIALAASALMFLAIPTPWPFSL